MPLLENGQPTGLSQVGAGDNFGYARPCKSGYSSYGHCSCKPGRDCTGSNEYCNWFDIVTLNRGKCVSPLVENGKFSNTASCGYAKQCKSGYSCGGYCSCKPGDCTNDDEICDQVTAETAVGNLFETITFQNTTDLINNKGPGTCKSKLENGEPTHRWQTGCSDSNDYAGKCKSGYSCWGHCSCKDDSECGDNEFCDSGSYKCELKNSYPNGTATNRWQVGCGDNNGFADKCESKWACGGYCSCKDNSECEDGKFCEWWKSRKCVAKKGMVLHVVKMIGYVHLVFV